MIEPAIVVVRLLQYAGAAILFGSSLFFVYAPLNDPRARRLLAAGAALLAVSSLLAIALQASLFSGSLPAGFTAEAFGSVVAFMDLGKAAVVRAAAAGLAFVLLILLRPGRSSWLAAAGLGAVATASLAWLGHGAASEGPLALVHLLSDVVHVLAAAAWLGALACFSLLLLTGRESADRRPALAAALARFSGVGSALVALVVLTGLVNAWVLVGPDHVAEMWSSTYGRLLLLKLALFAAMLGLAALNRFRLTPALRLTGSDAAIGALRRSIAFETAAGAAILVLVAWLGTLPPPA